MTAITYTNDSVITIDRRTSQKIKRNARKLNKRDWYIYATMQLGYKHIKAKLYALRLKDEPMFDI
ncbi:MAG: hypothetical protein J6X83_00070 [Methanomicrobium sp.]|nr:hypothetical protein [Methanomicrobium sp.]